MFFAREKEYLQKVMDTSLDFFERLDFLKHLESCSLDTFFDMQDDAKDFHAEVKRIYLGFCKDIETKFARALEGRNRVRVQGAKLGHELSLQGGAGKYFEISSDKSRKTTPMSPEKQKFFDNCGDLRNAIHEIEVYNQRVAYFLKTQKDLDLIASKLLGNLEHVVLACSSLGKRFDDRPFTSEGCSAHQNLENMAAEKDLEFEGILKKVNIPKLHFSKA